MSVRSFVEEQFKEDWADIPELADVWVVATQNELAAFSRTTAIVSQQSIAKSEKVPMSHRDVGMTLELVSHLADRDAGADELEAVLPALLNYLDVEYLHGTAEAFLYGNLLAYRIPFTVTAKKES